MQTRITSGRHGASLENDQFTLLVMGHSDGTFTFSSGRNTNINITKVQLDKFIEAVSGIKN